MVFASVQRDNPRALEHGLGVCTERNPRALAHGLCVCTEKYSLIHSTLFVRLYRDIIPER